MLVRVVFPTHVGVIPAIQPMQYACRRIPHTRGGDPKLNALGIPDSKYSPHTWGWSFYLESWTTRTLVFPTHVGVILWSSRSSSTGKGIPHTRGGDPKFIGIIFTIFQYSPHTWGWSHTKTCQSLSLGVFPTHVGVIPRLRCEPKASMEYSPHTWGWSIATETLAPVPYAKPVLKKDDPAGYERYKAYKRYSSLRNKAMKSLTLDQVSQWFESEKQRMN